MRLTRNMCKKINGIKKQLLLKFNNNKGSGNLIPKKTVILKCNCGVDGCFDFSLDDWKRNIIIKQSKHLNISNDIVKKIFNIDIKLKFLSF